MQYGLTEKSNHALQNRFGALVGVGKSRGYTVIYTHKE